MIDFTEEETDYGYRCEITCLECDSKLGTYLIYKDNGLVNPQREFDRCEREHICPDKPV